MPRLQFRLKTLFVFTTLAAVVAGVAPRFKKQSPPPSIAAQLKTCRDYFAHGLPGKAIEMMDADRRLISARGENECTPLHDAVGYGELGAVKWLLDNGADVNAIAYNGFTALHMTEEPKVVELILRKRPDLAIRCRIWDQTPFEHAVVSLADARFPEDKSKWREIVDLYRRAGVEFDLQTAIYLDDLARVKTILAESPEFADGGRSEKRSPLRIAASLGRLEICRYLVDNFPVDINDFDRGQGYPIIKEALAFPEIARLLIEHGADLKTRITWQGMRSGIWIVGDRATALHYAACDGLPETIRLLIDHGVDMFATTEGYDDDQQTALEVASFLGKPENVSAIIEHPTFAAADLDVRQRSLDRSLFKCTWFWDSDDADRPSSAGLLLAKGANPNYSEQGISAMQWAAREIHPTHAVKNQQIKQAIAVLRKHGATLDLFSAVAIGDAEEVARLVKIDPDSANARHHDGYPALHFAVDMDYREIVATLLAAGADVELRNSSETTGSVDDTPLHCAAFWGRDEIAKMLIDAGADVNALNERKSTPLHEADRTGSMTIAKLLLAHGADLSARDRAD
jgi:uncharacterized protein